MLSRGSVFLSVRGRGCPQSLVPGPFPCFWSQVLSGEGVPMSLVWVPSQASGPTSSFLIFGGYKSFWSGHWYLCFGLLVMSVLGFKARVDPLRAFSLVRAPRSFADERVPQSLVPSPFSSLWSKVLSMGEGYSSQARIGLPSPPGQARIGHTGGLSCDICDQ